MGCTYKNNPRYRGLHLFRTHLYQLSFVPRSLIDLSIRALSAAASCLAEISLWAAIVAAPAALARTSAIAARSAAAILSSAIFLRRAIRSVVAVLASSTTC